METSLARLGTDRLDIVHIHGFDQHIEAAFSGAHRALMRLKQEGVIGAIGGGCDSVGPLLHGLELDAFDAILCAGRYTPLDAIAAQKLLPLAAAKGCEVFIAGLFNSGILATGAVADARYDYGGASPAVLARVRVLEALCQRHAVALKAVAVQFPLRDPRVGTVLLGAANPGELRDSLAHLDASIAPEFWADAARTIGDPLSAMPP